MRIITGIAKGTRLNTLQGLDTRPTPERVKEAIFSMLQFDLEGRRILDLFAGSGQMALEAISRGAARAVLIDQNPLAVSIIKENAKKAKLFSQCNVLTCDAFSYLRNAAGKETFDIIFLDPPYALKLMPKLLNQIARSNILAPRALLICETEDVTPPEAPESLSLLKHTKYGRVSISVFTPKTNE
jgi:16S rRNA (guanine(966)-N(2))-methyltransferase RsmD